jgi:hypothetical protein
MGRYRFFHQVVKRRPETIGKTFFVGKVGDHAGFLELILPQQPLFRDKGIGWHNLSRLRLALKHDAKDVRGNLKEHFWNEPEVLGHLKSLCSRSPNSLNDMYFRTELGRSFAECCVPSYKGETRWHPKESK